MAGAAGRKIDLADPWVSNHDSPQRMDNIPKEIREKLKRLSPYIGADVPESVRQKAREFWPTHHMEEDAGWHCDGDVIGWELELCDIDADFIDPAGYAAIRPLGQGEFALEFVIIASFHFHPKNLIFQTVQEAQRYLDTLLAADTPKIPLAGAL
jgi:hypothetical protein